jgi:acetate kinase
VALADFDRFARHQYGFHGLSYASVLRSLASHLDVPEKEVDVVVCHLGSGGSVCLIEKGKSVDTSMGLTPLEGEYRIADGTVHVGG